MQVWACCHAPEVLGTKPANNGCDHACPQPHVVCSPRDTAARVAAAAAALRLTSPRFWTARGLSKISLTALCSSCARVCCCGLRCESTCTVSSCEAAHGQGQRRLRCHTGFPHYTHTVLHSVQEPLFSGVAPQQCLRSFKNGHSTMSTVSSSKIAGTALLGPWIFLAATTDLSVPPVRRWHR